MKRLSNDAWQENHYLAGNVVDVAVIADGLEVATSTFNIDFLRPKKNASYPPKTDISIHDLSGMTKFCKNSYFSLKLSPFSSKRIAV